jgi:predicted nucleic acid-binding protein
VTDRIFVDTSILIRAHDADAGERRAVAQHILLQLWEDKTGVLSALVLQEFYAALVARAASPVPRRAARELVDAYGVWPTVAFEHRDILAASELEERHRLPFRDATIVAAARKARATVLLSEQILPARHITGLDVQNPFA